MFCFRILFHRLIVRTEKHQDNLQSGCNVSSPISRPLNLTQFSPLSFPIYFLFCIEICLIFYFYNVGAASCLVSCFFIYAYSFMVQKCSIHLSVSKFLHCIYPISSSFYIPVLIPFTLTKTCTRDSPNRKLSTITTQSWSICSQREFDTILHKLRMYRLSQYLSCQPSIIIFLYLCVTHMMRIRYQHSTDVGTG